MAEALMAIVDWIAGRPIGRWLVSFAVGAGLGWGILMIDTPAFVLVAAVAVGLASLPSPRLLGGGGILAGTGLVMSVLLLTSSLSCGQSDPPQCTWTLAAGPAHLVDPAAWQGETRLWLAASLVVLAAGVLMSLIARRRAVVVGGWAGDQP